VEENLG